MVAVAAGQRSWKCPQCGREVLLSVTELDPIACDDCRAKMKSGRQAGAGDVVADAVAGPLGMWQSLPEMVKLGAVVGALVIGLLVGFIAGQSMAARPGLVRSESGETHAEGTHHAEASTTEEPEVRPDPPGPGYKWVRGRIRKDGTRPPGHWAKDPLYKGHDEDSTKDSK